jgi:hypothetical protein
MDAYGGNGCRFGAARTPGREVRLGTIGDGTEAPPTHLRPHVGPAPLPLRIGADDELLPSRWPARPR